MRHTFVLDENIAIGATTLRNVAGHRDVTCLALVRSIVANCHALASSVAIRARWSHHVQQLRLRKEAIEPSFMTVLDEAWQIDDKCLLPPTGDPPALPDEAGWSSKLLDDRLFIRLAAFYKGLLVTADEPLARDVAAHALAATHSFRVISPEEALRLASQPASGP